MCVCVGGGGVELGILVVTVRLEIQILNRTCACFALEQDTVHKLPKVLINTQEIFEWVVHPQNKQGYQ